MRFVSSLLCAATVLAGCHAQTFPSIPSDLPTGFPTGVTIPTGVTVPTGFPTGINIPTGFPNVGILTAGTTAGAGAGANGQLDPAALCAAIKAGMQAQADKQPIPNFDANIATTASLPSLPAIFSCLDGNFAIIIRFFLKIQAQKPNPATLTADQWASLWTSNGWPAGAVIPTKEQYAAMVQSLAAVNGGLNSMSGMPFPGGNGNGGDGNFPTGFPGFPAPQPPSIDFGNIFGNRDRVGKVCRVQCPIGTICLNEHDCVAPQPICATPCGPDAFCRSVVNATVLADINAQLQAGMGMGGGAQGQGQGQGEIHFGEDGQVQIGGQGQADVGALLNLFQAGGRVNGTCQSLLTPKCSIARNQANSCPDGQVCSPFEGCRRCEACGRIPDIDLTPYLNGGDDPSRLRGNISLGRGDGRDVKIEAGVIATIQAGLNQFTNFIFGNGTAGQAGSALLPIPSNARAQITQLISNLQDGAIQIAAGAEVEARDLQVAANSTLAVILGAADAHCRANSTFSLNGPLIIRGSATLMDIAAGRIGGRFDFPNNTDRDANRDAVINVAGGVALSGNVGGAKLSISAIIAAAAAASVPAGQVLRTFGDVLGAEGRLIVNGTLALAGSLFQPALQIIQGGRANITVGPSGNFSCGELHLTTRGWLDINANTSATAFQNFSACEANAVIRVRVASVAAAKSGVLFAYGALGASVRVTFKCTVRLYDDTGAEVELVNPNNVSAGRRLLQASSTPTVTWDQNGATYGTSSTGAGSTGTNGGSTPTPTPAPGSKAGSAAATAPTQVVALVAVLLAAIARLF